MTEQKKAQSAIEFVSLATFMFIVMVVVFAVVGSKLSEAREQANQQIAEDIASLVYREIEIALSVNCGYARTFEVPQTVNGVDYNIEVVDNRELLVNYLGYEYVKFIPTTIAGGFEVAKGLNKIENLCGVEAIQEFGPLRIEEQGINQIKLSPVSQ